MNEGTMPFFARFLEAQDYPTVESDVKAGPFGGGGSAPAIDHVHTMKYPSDDDENPSI